MSLHIDDSKLINKETEYIIIKQDRSYILLYRRMDVLDKVGVYSVEIKFKK